jgi:hypothetical protein
MNINTDKIILNPNGSVNINNSLTYYPVNSDFNTLYYNKEYFINKKVLYSKSGEFINTNLNFYNIPISELPQLTGNNYIVLNIKLSYITNLIPNTDIRYEALLETHQQDNKNDFVNAIFIIKNDSGNIILSQIDSSVEILCSYSSLNSTLNISLNDSGSITPEFLYRDTFLTAHIQILSFNKERPFGTG